MTRYILRICALSLTLLGFATSAHANLITNGSFEEDSSLFVGGSDATMVLGVGSTVLSGWTVTGQQIAWIGPGHPWGSLDASDGDYFLDLTSYSPGGSGGVAQTVVNTVVGQTYEFSFDLGSSVTYGASTDIIASVSAGSLSQQFFTTATSGNQWDTFSMTFTADSTTTALNLTGIGTAHTRYYIGLDNVVLKAVSVPEPQTILLFGLSLLAFAARRK